MATRRRIGISAATTEAARRQLMQPVPCWEKAWVVTESNSTGLKIYKWTKTEKTQVMVASGSNEDTLIAMLQQFSDEEGEVDEPLAPLPDEPEVVEGDEEVDQDETVTAVVPDTIQTDITDVTAAQDDVPSKPPSPKPQLSMTLQPLSDLTIDRPGDGLDASLKPLDTDMDVGVAAEDKANLDDEMELDISVLGPDGLRLEGSHDLSQIAGADALIGGPIMDQSADPFAEPADG